MLLFNRYEYHPQTDLIGKGGFSRVYKALDKKLNRTVALKIYKSSELAEKYSPIAEIQRVIDFDHPNISRYIDIDEVVKEDAFGEIERIQVCVLEYLDGGSLSQFYQTHKSLEQFRKLLLDVLRGLSYLHQNNVIHRDIRPANILIKNTPRGPVAKITDFGISKKYGTSGNSTSSALIVSIPYMAPEQLNAQKYGINENIGCNIDLWMLGVTVYEIISGDVLFKNSPGDSNEQIMTNITQSDIPEKVNNLPEPFKQFVQACLVKDAKERIQSADALLSLIQQPIEEATDMAATVLIEKPAIKEEPVDDSATTILSAAAILVEQPTLLPEADATHDEGATRILMPSGIETDAPTKPRDIAQSVNDDTVVLPKPATDDTVVMVKPVTEDTVVLPKANNDDTIVLQKPGSDDTVVMGKSIPAADEDATRILLPSGVTAPPSKPREKPTNLFNRYDYYPVSDCIGKGGFSRVYKAYDNKLSRWVALKIYKTGEFSDRYSPIAEIRRVVNLDHPNICRYLDMEEIENKNPFGENEIIQVCVMELLDGGNIMEYYRKNEDPQLLIKITRDILNGLAYLHRHNIIHRDIKPANILIKSSLEGPVAKITDFGISKATDNVSSNSTSALVVSIPYMAPEQLNIKKYGINEKIASNLDLWSLGVTLYEIITGKVLFKNSEKDSSEQVMANIMQPQLPEKIKELPEPFRKIVSMCVVKNATERVQKAEELLAILDGGSYKNKQQPTNTTQDKNSLFFLEEKEKQQTAKTKIITRPIAEEEEEKAPAIPLWQRLQTFCKQYSTHLLIGAAAVVVMAVLLFVFTKGSSNENNNLAPVSAPATTQPAQAPVTNTAVTPPPAKPVENTVTPTEPAKPEKTVVHESEAHKKKNVEREEKQEEKAIQPVNINEKVAVVISTSQSCSLRIESAENGYHEEMPLGSSIQLPLYPGKYSITATSKTDKKSGTLIVHPGKNTSYRISW